MGGLTGRANGSRRRPDETKDPSPARTTGWVSSARVPFSSVNRRIRSVPTMFGKSAAVVVLMIRGARRSRTSAVGEGTPRGRLFGGAPESVPGREVGATDYA